jgi:hypothetical protein
MILRNVGRFPNYTVLQHRRSALQYEIQFTDTAVELISMAARSKAWTVFARSNAGIVGSNPTLGVDVCMRLFCVYVILCVGSGLVTGWSPVQGVVPTVYRIKKLKRRSRFNKGL